MVDESKLQTIREFLQQQFPADAHSDERIPLRAAHLFRIERRGRLLHRLLVTEEFLNDRTVAQLRPALEERRVRRLLRRAGPLVVLVTNQGSGIWPE